MKLAVMATVFVLPFTCFSQAFHERAIIAGIGIDLGAYQTRGMNPSTGEVTKDGAVSGIFPLTFEYGLSDKTGLGLQIRSNNYGDGTDSANARNTDISILLNYHYFTAGYFDSYVGIRLGSSSFSYENPRETYSAQGMHFQLDAGISLYVSRRVAFQLHTGYNLLNYSNGKINASNGMVPYRLRLSGANIGTAIVYKFGKLKDEKTG